MLPLAGIPLAFDEPQPTLYQIVQRVRELQPLLAFPACCPERDLSPCLDFKLHEDVLQVRADGAFSDAQVIGNLAIAVASGKQAGNVPLSRAERPDSTALDRWVLGASRLGRRPFTRKKLACRELEERSCELHEFHHFRNSSDVVLGHVCR
jgi:hypothetical protein